MTSIIVMNSEEDFLQHLDPELCDLKETHEKDGLRTLELVYTFQSLHDDKQLFRLGNKVLILNDTNLTDCLYVINTTVEIDVYNENRFSVTLEEVLVELNYAPLFTQNELTSGNGFTLTTTNGQQSVTVNYNALNYWFGDYYNIGVVQRCLNESYNKISLSGTMNLMALLRLIEEETGNIFVTRYEKDCITNQIHRYLDFLNPLDVSKDWELNLAYDFTSTDTTGDGVYDSNNNPTTDTNDDVEAADDIVDWDKELADHTPVTNMDPEDVEFRITDRDGLVLNSDGLVFTEEDDTPLVWSSTDIGFDGSEDNIAFTLSMNNGNLGLIVNNRTFVVPATNTAGETGTTYISVANDPDPISNTTVPDDSWFEIYDNTLAKPVFRTCINREIGHVHEEVLDFGFNLENVQFETDEEETFTAISPILSLGENNDGLNKTQLGDLINKWKNLSISKGATVPMIVEKINVKASSLANARSSLGTYNVSSNYYTRPYKPQDQIDSSTPANSTWEFWRATAYWKAPYTKVSGELHIKTDNPMDTEYTTIYGRPDIRDDYLINRPKMGTVETSDEDLYAIYNAVALKLKEKSARDFNITVDVANLRRQGDYNNYELHDKVYVKLPDYQELVSARVVKTTKEAHDIAKNTITLDNYTTNNPKVVTNETVITADNVSFKYPNTKAYTVRLENLDYNSNDDYSVQYPANKLISFTIYKVENNTSTLTRTSYNKLTNANGYATVNLGLDPGDYEISISFGGDEEYEDTSLIVKCNVSGVVEAAPSAVTSVLPKDLPKQKTTKKTSDKSVKKTKRYYTKYGVSPDNKYLMAIGRPSASGELATYGYKFYKTVFKRKCPFCGSKELYWSIFWAGNEHANWGKFPATGLKEGGSAEGHIFCKHCDADFSTITGANHGSNPKKLTMSKKPVRCSKSDAYTLKKGKMYYDTVTKTVKEKKVTSDKTRTTPSGVSINAQVRQQALSIVGDSTGLAAAKKIAAWCGHKKNLRYDYYANFVRSAKTVMSMKGANCCDSTRYMLTLMAAAGCSEKLKLEYVHVTNGGPKGHVFAKITTRSSGKWRYVDPVLKFENGRNPWGHWYRGCGTNFGRITEFPTLPF